MSQSCPRVELHWENRACGEVALGLLGDGDGWRARVAVDRMLRWEGEDAESLRRRVARAVDSEEVTQSMKALRAAAKEKSREPDGLRGQERR
jgi:hypothetical protein